MVENVGDPELATTTGCAGLAAGLTALSAARRAGAGVRVSAGVDRSAVARCFGAGRTGSSLLTDCGTETTGSDFTNGAGSGGALTTGSAGRRGLQLPTNRNTVTANTAPPAKAKTIFITTIP